MRHYSCKPLAVLLATFTASHTYAAGFEKTVLWSGKYSGVAGAAVAHVSGSEAIFFNPAGLESSGTDRAEVSLNLSPTFSRFRAPIEGPSDSIYSDRRFSPVTGLTGSYKLSDRVSLGLGMYVAAGNRVNYNNLDFSSVSPAYGAHLPSLRGDLTVTEIALGGAYRIGEGFRVGAAWRVTQVQGTLHAPTVTPAAAPTSMLDLHLDDLKDTSLDGFKLGAQYQAPDARWGMGVQWRTAVSFTAKGKSSGRFLFPGAAVDASVTGGAASASSSLPNQIGVGAFMRVSDSWRLHAQYDWTEYRKNRNLDLQGTITVPLVGAQDLSASPFVLNWKNQHVARIGTEYAFNEALTGRAGYAYTSAVTPKSNASGLFSPPGSSHTFVAGIGKKLGANLEANLAAEYHFGKAEVLASDNPVSPSQIGEYGLHAFSAHTGVSYHF